MREKNTYTIHHDNMDEHQTMRRLRNELIQLVADKPHPVRLSEIQDMVKLETQIFRECISEELVKFLVAFDETRR
jgi:hypothetical protein